MKERVYRCVCTEVCVCTSVRVYWGVCVHLCIRVSVEGCVSIGMYTNGYICLLGCMFMCMSVCGYVCVSAGAHGTRGWHYWQVVVNCRVLGTELGFSGISTCF